MFGFRPLPPGGRSRKRATRALFIMHGAEGTPEGRSRGSCGNGCRRRSGSSSPGEATSRSSEATAESDTGSTPAPRSTCAKSTKEVAGWRGCVSCRSALCRSETSCSPRRSRWKHASARCALWPGGSLRTVSTSGEPGLSAEVRTLPLRGRVTLCRFALGFRGAFFAPASLAGFLPAIGSSISFWPAAAFFGFPPPAPVMGTHPNVEMKRQGSRPSRPYVWASDWS
jgi:hypothetical protein